MSKELPPKIDDQSDRRHQEIMTGDRLNWMKDLMGLKEDVKGSSERAKLKEQIDAKAEVKTASFDLGDSRVDPALNEAVNAANPEILVGSVDSTRFETKWHEAEWYKPFAEASVKIENLKKLFDEPTLKWYESLAPAFAVFQNLATKDDATFKKDVKNDIWNLVKKRGGEEMIYGPKGLFNFVLAYQRIEELYSPLELADRKEVELTYKEGPKKYKLADAIDVKKIKLVVGNGVGKVGGQKDRFAYAAIRKAAVKSQPTVVIPPVVPEKSKDVKKDFFQKYGIAPKEEADFVASLKVFDDFLSNKDRGMAFLKRDDWLKRLPEDGNEEKYRGRMSSLFSESTGEISRIRSTFKQVNGLFDKFFQDPNNPDAYKYVELYKMATLRSFQYAEQNLGAGGTDKLLHLMGYHVDLIEALDPLKDGPNKKEVLTQLIRSTSYISERYFEGEKAKWIKMHDDYVKRFVAID